MNVVADGVTISDEIYHLLRLGTGFPHLRVIFKLVPPSTTLVEDFRSSLFRKSEDLQPHPNFG